MSLIKLSPNKLLIPLVSHAFCIRTQLNILRWMTLYNDQNCRMTCKAYLRSACILLKSFLIGHCIFQCVRGPVLDCFATGLATCEDMWICHRLIRTNGWCIHPQSAVHTASSATFTSHHSLIHHLGGPTEGPPAQHIRQNVRNRDTFIMQQIVRKSIL